MNEQRKASPKFYKTVAVIFFVLGAIFIWAAIAQRSWFFAAFGIITVLNGLMSTLKSYAVREVGQ
jgi:1,4-dihydroxy-2-naphthoate octaprenyltransferase